jgi:hypothetical protein
MSVRFARAKHEAIEHLRANVLPTNRAAAKTRFPVMMQKIITEMRGEIKQHTFINPHGRQITAEVVWFPDHSFARKPDLFQLLGKGQS